MIMLNKQKAKITWSGEYDSIGQKIPEIKTNVKKEHEAEVVRRKQGIENARDERELRESQDQRQNSFVENFESGELVH